MRLSNERHLGSERGLRRVCPPLRYVSSGAQKIASSREFAEFQDQGLPSYVVPEFRVLAAQIWPTHRDLLGSENRKRSLSVREIRRIFGAGDVAYSHGSASASSWAGNTDPSADKAWVGRPTRGNSGLCRSYITDLSFIVKIVKISVVGNIGSDSKT